MPQGPLSTNVALNPSHVSVPLQTDGDGNLLVANSAATGQSIFVNEATGNDTTGDGSAAAPFATLTAALAAAVANQGDVIYLMGTLHVSATLTWAKNGVSLVGLNPPSGNNRSRISQTGSSVFSPLVDVTAQGCAFINLATFHGFADASTQICWKDEGGRNYYNNVDFLGMGNATAAAQAGSRSLLVTGNTGENIFDGCVIGLDTIVRGTAVNASLELAGGSPRNKFLNCVFQADVSLAGALHCVIGSGGIDRYALFKGCTFINAVDAGATAMSVAFTVNASAGGSVILQECTSVGATVYATTGPIYVMGSVPTATTSGLAVHAT